ncbi:Hypothetical predicted protein [Paramuricea clavata]|uniref:Uncharacterized protein n=1 Tax=Paramuricea clavata TaxID=317549 RepID=A0A6S7FUF3_PARCT|nr:Hypothetical predicted protein [Paramuricea clavata]
MAIWIAFIWFLSSVHPVKNIFIRNENDAKAKPGIGLVLVLFTAVVYGKTYFALRKQARSMIGKKTTFSSTQSQYAPTNKSISIESETCVEYAQKQDNRVQNEIERDQSLDERAENQNHRRAEKLNDRAQNQYERAEIKNHRAEKLNDRAQSQSECGEIDNERAKNQNQRAQNKNERVESQNERAQREDLSSKYPQNSQVISNAKEQKFLNTIIIIASIAVVTSMPGAIYFQLRGTVTSLEGNRILVVVGSAIYCLNFAANPFVYCLRLKRYKKTFKMVYGCKH